MVGVKESFGGVAEIMFGVSMIRVRKSTYSNFNFNGLMDEH